MVKHRKICTKSYQLWTMKKRLEEVQKGTAVSMSISECNKWKIKQGDKQNCETSSSTAFHTATKQTAAVFTVSVGVSVDQLYTTPAALKVIKHYITHYTQNAISDTIHKTLYQTLYTKHYIRHYTQNTISHTIHKRLYQTRYIKIQSTK